MSFSGYESYTDSGVEWLGPVPNHWTITPLKSIANVLNGYPFDSREFDPDKGFPLIRIRDLDQLSTETFFNGEFVNSAAVTASDVLIGMDGDFNVGRWKGEGTALLNQRMCCIRGYSDAVTRWLEYALPIPLKAINEVTYSTTVKHLSSNQVRNARIALPKERELLNLLSFLDRETGKIDALVDEQKRLIELLKEKRQAVISNAVTKGLDPCAPMKDSGIEWCGEIPAHWKVVPTGYRYSVQLGRMLDGAKSTGEHLRPYLRVFDVQWGFINTDDLPQMDFPPDARERYRLSPGDLLVNEGGSYVGRSAIWNGDIDECYYQKALHRLRPINDQSDTASFFLYVMEFATKLGVFVANGNQTTIDHLTAEKLRQYRFAFPPSVEQGEIVKYLNAETLKFDNLLSEAESAISLFQERRSALISAAVTGKIDVHNRIPQQAAAE